MVNNNISSIGADCCGCGNCANICHKSAISMMYDAEGFLAPLVDDSCVKCGVCLKVCPQIIDVSERKEHKSYVAISKDSQMLTKAASGGVFGTIANHILSSVSAFVCAASFVGGEVRHIITQDIKDLRKCQGSKYVQSNLGDCFLKIKEIIKDTNNIVLFCGTPCQVAALYSFLRNRPKNLFTLDLICHGVPSPKFFEKDIYHYSSISSKVENVRFRWRNPSKSQSKSRFILSIEKNKSKDLFSSNYDPYFSAFMRGESFRESCYKCHYANLNRIGDITIGDCDSASLYPNFHKGESKSTVIINNEHGSELWYHVNNLFDYIDLDLLKEANVNHQLSHSFKRPDVRDSIYRDAYSLSFKQMKNKYAPPTTKQQKILFWLQTYIPFLYKLLLEKTL